MSALPILMYHNLVATNQKSKGLSLSAEKLEKQLQFLHAAQYTTYHLAELQNQTKIAPKSVVLTFDDVTRNQLQYAVPLLVKYNMKATFFIPFQYVGGFDGWNAGTEAIMSVSDLQNLPKNIELGYHSFAHANFAQIDAQAMQTDFNLSEQFITENKLDVYPAFAYPYGKYPKKKEEEKQQFFKLLNQNKMQFGLRIGNRVNQFPFKNPYEILRIDIKGEDSLLKFKLKLKFGKLRLF
ncbi:polysaccharide deacetylase family protein [Flavobacterium agricola]|uniref:Polysaccharide deacetylase family protein n=1 Tax=Flavobacterium agricola TaxID=2870839 RepID=A0ABY6LWX7_9FLAO|nr:polysaccharide deacetylase family protein [Flavobacterium agricola]UYW00467.1 polysaccharide deacetylase family protein [Flavobacterium agricola]